MNSDQRKVVFAVSVIVGLSLFMITGLTFVIMPMSEQLELEALRVANILAVPSIAALMVVFLVGHVIDQFGHRKLFIVASLVFSAGSGVLVVSTSFLTIQLGLALCGAAAVSMQIAGISLIQKATVTGRAQASAFANYEMVFPLAFIMIPLATAAILQITNWRFMVAIWFLAGIVMSVVSARLIEKDTPTRTNGEWLTPLLADISLVGAAYSLARVGDALSSPQSFFLGVTISIGAGITCAILVKRLPNPGLSLPAIDGALIRALILGVGVVALVGILTFVSIALHYYYGLTLLEAALAIVPAQLGAALGARVLAKFVLIRWGGLKGSQILALALSISFLSLVFVTESTSFWYIVGAATLFSFLGMASLTTLNAEVMRQAPQGLTGNVSAFRTASSAIGAALGVGVLGRILLSTSPLDEELVTSASVQAQEFATSLRLVGVLACLLTFSLWIVLTFTISRLRHQSKLTDV
jgi:MFS family permease